MSRRKRLNESLDSGIRGGFGHSQVLLFSSTVDEFRRTAEDEAVKEGGPFMEGRPFMGALPSSQLLPPLWASV